MAVARHRRKRGGIGGMHRGGGGVMAAWHAITAVACEHRQERGRRPRRERAEHGKTMSIRADIESVAGDVVTMGGRRKMSLRRLKKEEL